MESMKQMWECIDALRRACSRNGECVLEDIECVYCDTASDIHEQMGK